MSKGKIIFDISEAIIFLNKNNCYSGIQRVVSMVINEFHKIYKDEDLWVGFLNENKQEYSGIKLSHLEFNDWASPIATKNLLKKIKIIGAIDLLKKYHNNKIKYYFHRTRLDIAALARYQSLFQSKEMTISDWKVFRQSNVADSKVEKLGDILQSGDRLVLLDSTWKKSYTECYKIIKSKGVKIFTLVHDLIPFLCPHYVDGGTTKIFYNWLVNSIEYTDCYLANSQYTRNDLQKFLQSQDCTTPIKTMPLVQVGLLKGFNSPPRKIKQINSLPNGLESDNIVNTSMRCKSMLAEPFALCIASNAHNEEIIALLLVWKRMLDKGEYDIPRLILSLDINNSDFEIQDFLKKTYNLNGYVSLFDDLNENELVVLIEKSLFVIAPIINNSYLLSIEKALANDKIVLISDKPQILSNLNRNLVKVCNFLSIDVFQSVLTKIIFNKTFQQDNTPSVIERNPCNTLYQKLDSSDIPSSMSDSNAYVLHVGTLEVRKNVWRLVLAWKKLLESGKKNLPRLVLAGRKGWFNEKLWILLEGTENLYGHVVILDKVSDEELDILYRNCLFTAMISTYEGWGLPVGESLAYGKTSVVANSTSLPEVGMDLVEYCDPLSVDSIADAVEKLIYDSDYRQFLESKIQNAKLRNWADVAHDLAKVLQITH